MAGNEIHLEKAPRAAAPGRLRACRGVSISRMTFIFFAVCALPILLPSPLHPADGWQGDLRLTNDPGSSFPPPNNCKNIAVDGAGRIHVVWADSRDKNYEIYHKYLSEGAWSEDTRLTFDTADSKRPNLAVDILGRVHLAWNDLRDGNMEIYHMMWDGSWGPEERVSFSQADSYASSMASEGYNIHMVYQEDVDGTIRIVYRSFDLFAWSAPEYLSSVESGRSMVPAVAAGPDGSVHAAWWNEGTDPEGTGFNRIRYREKTGEWSPEETISGPEAEAMRPSIVVDDSGRVHVAWIDKRGSFEQIYYRYRGDSGWEDEICLTKSECTHYHPSLALSGGGLRLVYWANIPSESNPGVFFMEREDASWSSALRVSSESSRASLCAIAAGAEGILHVAWKDDRDGNEEMYYNSYLPPGTGVEDQDEPPGPVPAPPGLSIHASPNPFNQSTTLTLGVPGELPVEIRIYDIRGRFVRRIASISCPGGTHTFAWDGRDDAGRRVGGGVYMAKATAGKMSASAKILLLR